MSTIVVLTKRVSESSHGSLRGDGAFLKHVVDDRAIIFIPTRGLLWPIETCGGRGVSPLPTGYDWHGGALVSRVLISCMPSCLLGRGVSPLPPGYEWHQKAQYSTKRTP